MSEGRPVIPEKLGSFYLGREYDLERRAVRDAIVNYDANDLTTHAVCVGMTGSGKTGLCLSLLEEAALDGIPAIAIDPKGDLGNLLLTFPELRASDFQPWIDPAEASRAGQTVEQRAEATAEKWRKGLAEWGQDGSRIARLREAAELAVYTPGSTAGRSLTVLRSFAAPPAAVAGDDDLLRGRVVAAVSGLLGLVGIDADPVRSREHVLLATLLDTAWRAGRDVELAELIRQVQSPPFDRVGVLDLESFFPEKARFDLAMALNGLLASPTFAPWLTGEPIDVGRLLFREDGRPRVAILSIAHLSDAERMFFVTLLLSEVVAWMRAQPGTSSLRALLYMDEVYGYLPPTANPPSKVPLLTLLKQARAYGLGVVLATQNPVDLDYKALSNAGTWLIGRLQAERDKLRVLDGLEGASATAGQAFDRARAEQVLGALSQRVFLMSNAHEDAPVVFQTRWALSYLRGPLTLEQVRTLSREARPAQPTAARAPVPPPAPQSAPQVSPAPQAAASRPIVQPGVVEGFLPRRAALSPGERLEYRPALLASARVHHVSAPLAIDRWSTAVRLALLPDGDVADPWVAAEKLGESPRLDGAPEASASFAALPAPAARASSHAAWGKALVSRLYQDEAIELLRCAKPKATSEADEAEGAFRARISQLLREERDRAVEALKARHAPDVRALEERIRKAQVKVDREKEQYGQSKSQAAISLGATVLGALFGRKIGSVGNVGRATTTMRGASRAMREREDIARAEEDVKALHERLAALDDELRRDMAAISTELDASRIPLERVPVAPRKSDLDVTSLALCWTPWRVRPDGTAERAW